MDEPSLYGPRGVSNRASFGQRFLAYLIDVVLLNFAGFVLSRGLQGFSATLVNLLIFLLYFAFLEGGGSGQTLGKRALGIRVVDFESGSPIGTARGFARTVGRWVSGIVFLLGYFWMLWDRDRQTWHDKIASTTVVRMQRSPLDQFPT